MPTLPLDALSVIPHRGGMLLVDQLVEYAPQRLKGSASIREGNLFLTPGGPMRRAGLVEVMAQTVAAGNGYNSIITGKPVKMGLLVGLSDFRFFDEAFQGDPLLIQADHNSKVGSFAIVDGEIRSGHRLIASGSIKFYEFDPPAGTGGDDTTSLSPHAAASSLSLSPILCAIAQSMSEPLATESGMTAQFRPDSTFAGFNGHFPGLPVLPGVVMIEAALLLTEALAGSPLRLLSIDKVKFSRQVLPGDTLRIDTALKESHEGMMVLTKMTVGHETAASFILRAERMESGERG